MITSDSSGKVNQVECVLFSASTVVDAKCSVIMFWSSFSVLKKKTCWLDSQDTRMETKLCNWEVLTFNNVIALKPDITMNGKESSSKKGTGHN